ncbi:(dimethylallyl)adenosine tRNA methylthiotransferase MiaB [Tanacetum coccineum]
MKQMKMDWVPYVPWDRSDFITPLRKTRPKKENTIVEYSNQWNQQPEFLKEKVQERKRANREARQKRKQALEERSREMAAINNTRFYKFYPLEAPDNTVMPKVVEATGKILIGVVNVCV